MGRTFSNATSFSEDFLEIEAETWPFHAFSTCFLADLEHRRPLSELRATQFGRRAFLGRRVCETALFLWRQGVQDRSKGLSELDSDSEKVLSEAFERSIGLNTVYFGGSMSRSRVFWGVLGS